MKSLPNILTSARLVLALFMFVALAAAAGAVPGLSDHLTQETQFGLERWAIYAFVIAAVTDFFDGYLARAWSQQSSLGRMLDPIADKLLVAAVLLVLAADKTIAGWSLWAAIVILCREILVSGLREYLAELRVPVPVSTVAKWKTTAQLVALGFLIAGQAGEAVLPGSVSIGIVLLWVAAILTLYTGWDYMKASYDHVGDA